jgi:hypothetical protein
LSARNNNLARKKYEKLSSLASVDDESSLEWEVPALGLMLEGVQGLKLCPWS